MNAEKDIGQAVLRVALSGDGAIACHSIISRLKQESDHLRLSPSRVMSVITSRYFQRFFTDDIGNLVPLFFDPKEFLASEVPKALTEEALKEVLSMAMARLSLGDGVHQPRRSGKNKKPLKTT